MSASATSRCRIALPSGVLRLSVTLFTPRLLVSKKVLPMPGRTVMPREGSPPPGGSILITSAPRSAISMYGTVPACAVEQATTFTPCRGPCRSVMSNHLRFDKRFAWHAHQQHFETLVLPHRPVEFWQAVAVLRIVPAFELRRPLLGE